MEGATRGTLARSRHALHCQRCMTALPGTQVEIDSSRVALAFYCLGSLDLLGAIDAVTEKTREGWRNGLWSLYTNSPDGSGFKSGSQMTIDPSVGTTPTEYDSPHLIMTYAGLLALSILRDSFEPLDRHNILTLLRSCQKEDGSFSTTPSSTDTDLRSTYCAFAVSSMLGDWSSIDLQRSVDYIRRCRTYEGGYGQQPFGEAIAGTTYCALAALDLFKSSNAGIKEAMAGAQLTKSEHRSTIRWLLQQQSPNEGGFAGRTNKAADACYCFWCGASIQILGASGLVHASAQAQYLNACQYKFGGIAKIPDEQSDPYHTYMSLAALAMYPAPQDTDLFDHTWKVADLDPVLNATVNTAKWAREKLGAKKDS